jgi:hypothetical protein
MTPPPAS